MPRPRLIERINAGLDRKLTLVSVPAGFGKTTLLSEWIHVGARSRECGVGSKEHTSECPSTPYSLLPTPFFAWLSLDESDNDPTRFLAYFIAALHTIEARQEPAGNIGKGALSALQSPQPPPTEVILTSLINEVAALSDRMILVLDDYHLIEAQPIHDALTFLLRHLPPLMHLVIATREDPPLSLARLRARGQLTELRATDLRFAPSEAAEFLSQVMGLDLSEEDIAALETRTEGWIAGLQLAAISMQGSRDAKNFVQSFAGSHRYVLDYLIEEVLHQQSESIQAFLLQTSILDRLYGSLCDAVLLTPSGSGQQTLEYLEHANLFIVPLDEERHWYRYHHLFADLLRQRLRQIQSELVPELHSRASKWYEQNRLQDQAIDHALAAGDYERVAYLIEDQADAIWERGEHAKYWRWLEKLPVDLVSSDPLLGVLYAETQFARGQMNKVVQSLRAAEQAFDPESGCAADPKLLGRIAANWAFVAAWRGDVPSTIQYAHQALDALPEKGSAWRAVASITLGDGYSLAGELEAAYQAQLEAVEACRASGNIFLLQIAYVNLAVTLRQQGRLQQTLEICRQQVQMAQRKGLSQTVVVGWFLAIWGEVLAELNDLDAATDKARKGVALTESHGDIGMLSKSYLCLVRVLCSKRDIAGAKEIFHKLDDLARASDLPPHVPGRIAAWKVRSWLAEGRLEAASQWATERGLCAGGVPSYGEEAETMALARVRIAQGRSNEAVSLLERLIGAATAGGRSSMVIEILVLQALAFQAGDATDQAMAALERALVSAEPEGFVGTFVDEGPPIARLLYKAAAGGIVSDYTRRLLSAFPVTEAAQTDVLKPQTPESGLIEPLSERELEVLQLIAEGLTNSEIASRLFLSLHTIKAHARNIYGKLGVHNRMEAVARAQALGLLLSP